MIGKGRLHHYGIWPGRYLDVASAGNIDKHETDLGHTLAGWDWENSRLAMLPRLGPSTVRDTWGSCRRCHPRSSLGSRLPARIVCLAGSAHHRHSRRPAAAGYRAGRCLRRIHTDPRRLDAAPPVLCHRRRSGRPRLRRLAGR
ncbi:MAG: hypothetical protein EA370_16615 [Wenzhouxiangella sp.]|nr:MAG: hypothetical protein EA370_16615 [Wenzhouxiangella sp.]